MAQVKVRFAPSPTGPLHIGGARSALFNWLFARHHNGTMVVRIEDTDIDRSTREYEDLILDSLRWLGLDWDEGIGVGGPNGPYRQRERLDIYHPYVEKLLASGQAYHCYCSEDELEAERQELMSRGELPRYLGKCRELSIRDKEEKCAAGRKPVVRFRVPEGRTLTVEDLVRGRVEFESDGIGDFIIVKSDGIPTYNFAVVMDDALMGITHILRGEEHLSNTPRQILIYEALNFSMPHFAHISLILGEDRSKMSKRHGATSVVQYREQGYLPEALVNFLSLLGWSPEGEEEIFPIDELVRRFSLDRVSKSPAVFNFDKLKWMNWNYIKESSPDRITELCLPHLKRAGLLSETPSADSMSWLKQVVATVQEKLEYAAQAPDVISVFFGDTVDVDSEDTDARQVLALETSPAVIRAFREKALEHKAWDSETVRSILKEIGKELGVKGKALFMTVRVAVSGQSHGPDLNALLTLVGPETVARRLEYTLKHM
ncbi:MAG: glutamate--tRNA ligase [Bacillota bacterium]|nr:glutamate--tRNA ligase [Bacillota bacterium]MDW7683777.1 glutamate--tRNA ligase [Bacillota bacterium]